MFDHWTYDLALIAGMFVVTFGIRFLPFAFAHKLDMPAWLHEALGYVPVAALTAIIAPIVVYDEHSSVSLGLDNHQLWAAIVAFLVAYLSKNLLLTVSIGMGVFFVMKWFSLGG